MKNLFVFILVCSTFTTVTGQADNQVAFEKYLKEVYDAFENGGFEDLVQYYSPDVTEIGPEGNQTNGIEEAKALWNEMEKMFDAKPKFTYQLTSWRLIKPDIAIITWDAAGEFSIQGQKIQSPVNSSAALLRKENGNWIIEFDQMTPKMAMAIPDQEAEISAINALAKEAYSAFEARNAKRFGNVFSEDAILISPMGQLIESRNAIEKTHEALFNSYPAFKAETGNLKVSFITPEIAIGQWMDKVTMELKPGEKVSEERTFVNIVQKMDGKWLCKALSITPVKPMPALPNN